MDRKRFRLKAFIKACPETREVPGNIWVNEESKVYISYGGGWTWFNGNKGENDIPILLKLIMDIYNHKSTYCVSDIEIEVEDCYPPRRITNYWLHNYEKQKLNYDNVTDFGIF